MSNKFRIMTLKKIAASAGILTSFACVATNASTRGTNITSKMETVNQTSEQVKRAGILMDITRDSLLRPANFKKALLNLKPGSGREDFIFDQVTKSCPFDNMVPITVPGPGGTKITYKVMPDFVMIDGQRITMSAHTAQRIANHCDLRMPPEKMAKQIYDKAETKVRPAPLSSEGVTIDGVFHTGKEVVSRLLMDPRAAAAYNEQINEAMKGKEGTLSAGQMKTLTAPSEDNTDRTFAGGWEGESGQALQGYGRTIHGSGYHDYSTGARFASNDVVIEMPDGSIHKVTLDQIMNHKDWFMAVSDTLGTKKYKI